MKKKGNLARKAIESNIDEIAELIKSGYFYSDIYKGLIEKGLYIGSYNNFFRILNSKRYEVINLAIEEKKSRVKNIS